MKIQRRQMVRSLAITAVAVCGGMIATDYAAAQGPGQKPFQNIYRRPNLSPYNQLTQQNMNPQQGQTIYQSLVQPQLEQQRQQLEQISQRRQVGTLQNQVRQIQQGTQSRQIDEMIRPTGHASTYMNYSHYYPMR